MKCEYCGANLTWGIPGIDPATFIKERQEQWAEMEPLIEYAKKMRRVEETAQGILDVRTLYPDKSLAWLYDEVTMPPELREAHRLNDLAVMDLYGFDPNMTEPEIVAELMRMYGEMSKTADEERSH